MAIQISSRARKTLVRLPRNRRGQIRQKIAELSADDLGKNPQIKKLVGQDGYRLRVGDWRILFYVRETDIYITRIASRGDAYQE